MSDEFVNNQCCADRREACEKLIQAKLEFLNDVFETKLEATEKARELAAQVLGERLHNLNELRKMAQDRDVEFVTKDEHNYLLREIETMRNGKADKSAFDQQVLNIEQLRLSEAKLAGKADSVAVEKVDKRAEAANGRGNLATVIAIISIIVSIAIHFIK